VSASATSTGNSGMWTGKDVVWPLPIQSE
jgi:hypothetical protein